MIDDDEDITPRILLQHMQEMKHALIERMDRNHAELKSDIQRVERKVDTLTLGVDAIDARLDTIEIEKLPQRVKALEMQR